MTEHIHGIAIVMGNSEFPITMALLSTSRWQSDEQHESPSRHQTGYLQLKVAFALNNTALRIL